VVSLSPNSAPRPGEQLGDFQILNLLGEGAMGKVYEARQLSLQRRVALKVLPAENAGGGQDHAVTRFYREARAAAQLQHPSIVPVYDFGIERGHYYYAMQYVPGKSLADVIREGGTRDMHQVATWARDLARALAVAHGQGVIHRDVKPANILIREDNTAALTDFGLSRVESAKSITQVGSLVGTPVYMAPEQARGEKATPSVDVYALGVTLYECLAQEVPFMAEGLRELLVAITEEIPRPPSEVHGHVPPALEAITLRAIAKRPEGRYASAAKMGDDLERYLRGEPLGGLESRGLPPWALLLLPLFLILGWGLGSWRANAGRQAQAEAALAAAEGLEGRATYDEAAAAFRRARANRDSALRKRAQHEPPGEAALTRAQLSLEAAERRLLQEGAAQRAYAFARQAATLSPESEVGERAKVVASELLEVLALAAERQGEDAIAAAWRNEGAQLSGQAAEVTLSLATEPAGAQVTLRPIELGPSWKAGQESSWGATPVEGRVLALGHYLLEVRAPGRVTLRVPLRLEEPGSRALNFELPDAAGIPPGFVYVPPGPFLVGGDPEAVRPLAQRRQEFWVAGVFVAEREVTMGEYAAFLEALPKSERDRHGPKIEGLRTADLVSADHNDHPMVGVSFESARAYCRWRSQADPKISYRLPTDLEWEKAARPFPELAFPWGTQFDFTAAPPLAWLHQAGPGAKPRTAPCGSHPKDRSLYGILDLGGNAAEWVEGEFGGDRRFNVLRGGSWLKGPELVRSSSRYAVGPGQFLGEALRSGFRLAFD
jgi:eukaryotic-like serine/threonine-protein kinase